jgi:hypothetical protein
LNNLNTIYSGEQDLRKNTEDFILNINMEQLSGLLLLVVSYLVNTMMATFQKEVDTISISLKVFGILILLQKGKKKP